MSRDLLTLLTRDTYRRSDFAYRLSLIREFLEYVFFTKRALRAQAALADEFGAYGQKSPAETAFIKSLPDAFLGTITQASMYEALTALESEYKKLDAITLTVPVLFPENDVAEIGQWVRKEVGDDVVLEFTIDPAVVAGCRVAWRSRVYDFSFEHYAAQARENIRAKLLQKSGTATS